MRLLSDFKHVVFNAAGLARNLLRSRSALAAENLFLRKQLTFFVERERSPRRTDYVLVVMEIGTRKIVHVNVTPHPTAEWTLQQFREAIPCEHSYRFLIVDRDSKFSEDLRKSVRAMGVRVLRTPPRTPQANSYCERLLGTTRRECMDFLIPLSEDHLRRIIQSWVNYYNRARPHSSLGPNVPDRGSDLPVAPGSDRHQIPTGRRVVSTPVLGGLHHDYRFDAAA